MRPFDYFGRFLCSTQRPVIVDRLHYCEAAYGKTFRGRSELDRIQWAILELMLKTHDAKVIYLKDDFESIKSRWNEDEMFPVDKMENVMSEYEKFSDSYDVIAKLTDLVDINTWELTDAGYGIVCDASHYQKPARPLPAALGMGRYGGVLILGDVPSKEKRQGATTCPFREGQSSELLWNALLNKDGSFVNPDIFLVNASSFHGDLEFQKFADDGQFKRIICLGENALKVAKKRDTQVIEHPGYIQRFARNKSSDWIDSMRRMVRL